MSINDYIQSELDKCETLCFAEYVLSKAKEIFGTDDLDNNDVCDYFIASLKKNNKSVEIELNDLVPYNEFNPEDNAYNIVYEDPDNNICNYIIFCGTKMECLDFINDKGLTRE